MAIPYRLLMDAEEVVVHRHPHVRVLFRPAVITVAVVGVAGLLGAVVSHASTRLGIAAVALVVLGATVLRPVLHWVTTTLTITDRRLLLRSGVFARYGRDVPLGRIEDVSFEHTLLERMLGCGTLYVELARERGMVVVQNVPKVEDVHGALYQLLDEDSADAESLAGDNTVDGDTVDGDTVDGDWVDGDWVDEDGDDEEPAVGRRWLRRRAVLPGD